MGGIAAGADGNVWFTEGVGNKIGRITPTGTITEFTIPTASSGPLGIAAGADGNVWFTENSGNKVGLVGDGAAAASVRAPSVTGSGQQGTQQVCQGDEWAQWAGEPPSYSAVAFDGYQWLRDGRPIAGQTGQAYTPSTGDVGQQLSCTVTVTYPLLNVTVSATSTAVTVIPQASGPQGQTGLQGPTGRQGPTGKQGRAGKVELVKCKAVKRKHKTKQVCTTKLVTGPVKFATAAADERAALSHHGVIYATGYARQTHAGVQTWLARCAAAGSRALHARAHHPPRTPADHHPHAGHDRMRQRAAARLRSRPPRQPVAATNQPIKTDHQDGSGYHSYETAPSQILDRVRDTREPGVRGGCLRRGCRAASGRPGQQ